MHAQNRPSWTLRSDLPTRTQVFPCVNYCEESKRSLSLEKLHYRILEHVLAGARSFATSSCRPATASAVAADGIDWGDEDAVVPGTVVRTSPPKAPRAGGGGAAPAYMAAPVKVEGVDLAHATRSVQSLMDTLRLMGS